MAECSVKNEMERNGRGPVMPVLLWREQVKPREIQIERAGLWGRYDPSEHEEEAFPA
jgi:hypothetical protein